MTEPRATAARGAPPRWVILVGAAIVLVFMAAMITQYSRTRGALAEADRLRRELAVARAEATIAAAALDAQRGSHETARRLASQFFTELQATVAQAPAAVQPTIRTILGQRDATITLLSRGDPESAAVLTRMFTEYRAALHGPAPR